MSPFYASFSSYYIHLVYLNTFSYISCIYAETTLKTYVKLRSLKHKLQHKYEELLKCITPYHLEGDLHEYRSLLKNSSSAHLP